MELFQDLSTAARIALGLLSFIALIVYVRWEGSREDQKKDEPPKVSATKSDGAFAGSVYNSPMSMQPDEATQEQIDRIGSMIGKVFVIALAAFLLWGYSTTFLAQVGLL